MDKTEPKKRHYPKLSGEPFIKIIPADAPLPAAIGHDDEYDDLTDSFIGMSMPDERGVIELTGVPGTGRKFLVRRMARLGELGIICLRVREILSLSVKKIERICDIAVKKSDEGNALIYLEDADVTDWSETKLQIMISFLQSRVKILIAGTQTQWPDSLRIDGTHSVVFVSFPSYREQKQFWIQFAYEKGVLFDVDVDLDEMVSKYDMSPERIRSVIERSALLADIKDDALVVDKELLQWQVRVSCTASFGEMASRLDSPFTWDDLQISDESKQLLEEAADRIRYRSVVNMDFGFGGKLPYGRGTSVVLYGPPGTGKTMAAQVMANELGLDIYRVDLSQIGSKYIGETEKNLGSVFDAARYSNAILFFDEADALFTKRTEVTTSNDRYANNQTAYLLQKMEEYSGMSILATNGMQNFDNAFKRRMTYTISIERPDEATRLLLWENAFPKDTPLEDDIYFETYAHVAELTGSHIKSAAISAAYRAAAQHRKVTNDDLVRAVDMECKKIGTTGIGNELYAALYAKKTESQLTMATNGDSDE